MIPEGGEVLNAPVEDEEQPYLTWHMDFSRGKIIGKIDELAAVKETIFQILQTERYQYLIYSFDYGSEFRSLIGIPPLFVQSEAQRIIEDALIQDDRIESIEDFSAEINGDSIKIRFRAETIYDSLEIEQEVLRDI